MVGYSIHAGKRARRMAVLLLSAVAVAPAAMAQPGNSPDKFGDRQSGHWGDAGQGHFGNPAAGNFDQSNIRLPPPGAKPLGKVYRGNGPDVSPYISLPTPADAAMEIQPPDTPTAADSKKKPAKKRAGKKAG